MSMNLRDLKVAEMLKRGSTYGEIEDWAKEQGTPISRATISSVKKLIDEGVVAFSDSGVAREAEPKIVSEIHEKVVGVVTKKAAEEAVLYAEQDYELGRELRQFWFLKAQEKGLTLRDFVKSALIFYDDYRDVAAENEELKNISRSALEGLRVNTAARKKLELYYKFCRDMINLKAQGFSVPQQVIVDFYSDLEYLSKGGEYPIQEVLRNVGET